MTESESEERPLALFADYSLTSDGRVFSNKFQKRKQISVWKDGYGYHSVTLWKDGRQYHRRLHVLLAETFLGPRPEWATLVRHLDDDKENIALANLAWGTHQDNVDDRGRNGHTSSIPGSVGAERRRGTGNGRAILDESKVRAIQTRMAAGANGAALAREYGVGKSTIYRIHNGKTWNHL